MMKDVEQLADVDRDAGTYLNSDYILILFFISNWKINKKSLLLFVDDVLARMMDDKTAESVRSLFGHSGPVYCLSFSPERNLLLSCSEDGTGMKQILIDV